jgi:hypothetical protein
MAEKKVDPEAIRALAKEFKKEDGPIVLLRGAKRALDEAELGALAMGLVGIHARNQHEEARKTHVQNLAKGIEGFTSLGNKLETVANNWKKSDKPWVVKDRT